MNKLKRILYVIVQCTWGLGQTLLGLAFFIAKIKYPHSIYRGCIETTWKGYNGLSLGLFIFAPDEEHGREKVRVHEYGHTIQSLVLGPFYIIVGIISVVWANLPYYEKKRKKEHIPYTRCFVESNASHIGEKVTGEKAAW